MRPPDPIDDELTPEERAAFAALPREREPGRLLEERIVRNLRDNGLLQARRPDAVEARRRIRFPAQWIAGAAAACVAMFASGLAVGQWMGARTTERVANEMRQQSAQQSAALVQQTGQAYVTALSRLAADTTNPQAKAAAVQALRAAADQVVRIAPDDPVASGILAGYDRAKAQAAQPQGATQGKERVVWF
ncbi:MAG TPA: hypothetical protein VHG91_21700 [Longimicrobium sp.]|nr:hypothetical protein [Longimicrobium sp.]